MLSRLFNRFIRVKLSEDPFTEDNSPLIVDKTTCHEQVCQLVDNHLAAASAYQLAKRYEAAVRECDQALSLNPTDATAYRLRALARYNCGDFMGARQDWATSKSLTTDSASHDVG